MGLDLAHVWYLTEGGDRARIDVPWSHLCTCVHVELNAAFGDHWAELEAFQDCTNCDGPGRLELPALDPLAGSIPLDHYQAILRGERLYAELMDWRALDAEEAA